MEGSNMDNKERQNALDVQKWLDSEQKGEDCCGSYDYCQKCNKEVEYPCAAAYEALNAKQEKPATAKKTTTRKTTAKKSTGESKKTKTKKA